MNKTKELWSEEEYNSKQEDRKRETEKIMKENMKRQSQKDQVIDRIDQLDLGIDPEYLTVEGNIEFEMSGMLSLTAIEALSKEFHTRDIEITLGSQGGGCPTCGDYGSPSGVVISNWS